MSNKNPVVPFKIMCILLYGTHSWLRREGTTVYVRSGPLNRVLKNRKQDIWGMLDWLQGIGLITRWSRPAPGYILAEVRLPPPETGAGPMPNRAQGPKSGRQSLMNPEAGAWD